MLAMVLLAQIVASGGRPLPTPVPSTQRGGSISARAGTMKLNQKALDGFGDPPPPGGKPALSTGSATRTSPAPKAPLPQKGKKKKKPS